MDLNSQILSLKKCQDYNSILTGAQELIHFIQDYVLYVQEPTDEMKNLITIICLLWCFAKTER